MVKLALLIFMIAFFCSCTEKANDLSSSQSDSIAYLKQLLSQDSQQIQELKIADSILIATSETKNDSKPIVPTVATSETIKPQPASESQDEQWQKFRNNEDKYVGSKVKWKVEVDMVYNPAIHEPPSAFLTSGEWCVLYDLQGNVANGNYSFPKIHTNDWLLIEGTFQGVNDLGNEEIFCSKITRTNRP